MFYADGIEKNLKVMFNQIATCDFIVLGEEK